MVTTATDGKDFSFEQIAELRSHWTTYRAYRTDGGATTDFGIVLRRERTILPGLKYVRVIYSRYHASDASLVYSSENAGQLTIEAYGPEYPAETFAFKL